jgi:hypothetical protein
LQRTWAAPDRPCRILQNVELEVDMKSTLLASLASAVLLGGAIPHPASTAGEATPLHAQQLFAPRKSSKVAAVIWTRRSDRYTLQVVFPRTSRITPIKQDTSVTLWLLGPNGTVIPAISERPLGPDQGVHLNEVAFRVSLQSGDEAVAAALKIDDEYFVEALRPLK